jgi:arginyl-tRNA synthetase
MLLERLKSEIYQDLQEAALQAREEGKLSFEELPLFTLEKPREKEHGDLAANIAMVLARPAKNAPRKIAQAILEYFPTGKNQIVRHEIAGPGFINIFLDPSWVYDVLPEVEEMDGRYGCTLSGENRQKIQVEFVSANPTGLLHMGNARGAALGDTLANVLAAVGHEVTKEFYINDTGKQIENFGRSLEARYLQLLGQDVPFPESGYPGEDLIESMGRLISAVGDKYLQVAPQLRASR